MSWWSTTCAWWPTSPRTDKANGERSLNSSIDKGLVEWIRDKAKGKTIWRSSGQAKFRDYNRNVTICWEALI